ncbi:hypothetical protein [Caudoviricetes sp.]|nr:hypothetical protein [Caudoviricetes sp.]
MLWLLGLEAERHEQAPQGAPDELAELVENTCPPEEARARVARAKRELGQAPQGAPRGLSDDWTDEQRQTFFATVRGACTCPRVGPNAPTVGFYRRPAIVIGHQPRCPALEVIWSRDRD